MGLAKHKSLELLHLCRYSIRAGMGSWFDLTPNRVIAPTQRVTVLDQLWYYVHLKPFQKYARIENTPGVLCGPVSDPTRIRCSNFLRCLIPTKGCFVFIPPEWCGKLTRYLFRTDTGGYTDLNDITIGI